MVRESDSGHSQVRDSQLGNRGECQQQQQQAALVLGSPGVVLSALRYHFDLHDTAERSIDLNSELEIEQFVDETTWSNKVDRCRAMITEHDVSVGVLVHPGLRSHSASKDKETRLASALLLRMLSIITARR